MPSRKGLTILEVLVVIAIIGVLLGLLIPAILAVREAANRIRSQNNQRQIVLAMHNFASDHEGRLPSADGDLRSANPGKSYFGALLEYLESTDRLFQSPADPSLGADSNYTKFSCSYAANWQVFKENPRLSSSVPDGTSITIALAEHYSTDCQGVSFHWHLSQIGHTPRRATFADRYQGDIVPVTTGSPPESEPLIPGYTFQVRPIPIETKCFPLLAQTPHRGGMLVSMMDGSSRIISGTVAPPVYWAAVTPAGGESPSD